jgi:hypothetical protein
LLVTPSSTLKGIADVLEKEVIPDLNSNYPKAQSHAIVSMLQSLAVWEEQRDQFLAQENSELERLLRRVRSARVQGKKSRKIRSLFKRFDKILGSKPTGTSAESHNFLLRKLLDDTLLFVASDPGWHSTSQFQKLRKEIRKALKKRIKFELAVSSPSKMAEFSKGD